MLCMYKVLGIEPNCCFLAIDGRTISCGSLSLFKCETFIVQHLDELFLRNWHFLKAPFQVTNSSQSFCFKWRVHQISTRQTGRSWGSLVSGYDSRSGCRRSRVQILDEPKTFAYPFKAVCAVQRHLFTFKERS